MTINGDIRNILIMRGRAEGHLYLQRMFYYLMNKAKDDFEKSD